MENYLDVPLAFFLLSNGGELPPKSNQKSQASSSLSEFPLEEGEPEGFCLEIKLMYI